MRKYYSDYVKHCTKFFFTKSMPPMSIENRVDYNNYISVSNVLSRYGAEEICLIRFVYSGDNMPKLASEYAASRKKTIEEVWYTIQKYEKEVAIERGLL